MLAEVVIVSGWWWVEIYAWRRRIRDLHALMRHCTCTVSSGRRDSREASKIPRCAQPGGGSQRTMSACMYVRTRRGEVDW